MPATAENIILVRRLVKKFGSKSILKGMDFQATPGEFVALLGSNGAGKTTFLRILATLLRPSGGEVILGKLKLPDQALEIRRIIGLVGHQPMVYGELSALENLQHYGRLYGVLQVDERAKDLLEWVGLSKYKNDAVRTFSRGMQQRLAIARAILPEPQILLLDEPHTGLDQDACDRLDQVLSRMHGEKRTILMTTHDLGRAATLAGRFDVLSRGQIHASIQRSELEHHNLLDFYRQALAERR